MFFAFVVIAAVALALIQLGALSVWVAVLSLSLKAVLLVIFVVALYSGLSFSWRRFKG